jgi:hypothetical protein
MVSYDRSQQRAPASSVTGVLLSSAKLMSSYGTVLLLSVKVITSIGALVRQIASQYPFNRRRFGLTGRRTAGTLTYLGGALGPIG